jgi:hypothetical protein
VSWPGWTANMSPVVFIHNNPKWIPEQWTEMHHDVLHPSLLVDPLIRRYIACVKETTVLKKPKISCWMSQTVLKAAKKWNQKLIPHSTNKVLYTNWFKVSPNLCRHIS